MSHRILLVEDDARLATMVSDYLGEAGFRVSTTASGAEAERLLKGDSFDAAILDLMLPDMDGLDLCRRVRAESTIPVLMLTARGDPLDRVVGLELGADDYLPKPFEPRELLARLRAILRRGAGGRPVDLLRFGRLEIDRGAREARIDGQPRALTGFQFTLLVALAERAGRVLSREALLDLTRGAAIEEFDRSIDVHISRLRAALEDDPKKPRRILSAARRGLRVRAGAGSMKRLHLKLYLAVVSTLMVFTIAAALIWHFFAPREAMWGVHSASGVAALIFEGEPPTPQQEDAMLEALSAQLRADVALFSPGSATPQKTRGWRFNFPPVAELREGWQLARHEPLYLRVLADGRRLVVHPRQRFLLHGLHLGLLLVSVAVALALIIYPITRGITARLGRLETGVRELGEGNLAARVAVEGTDEVAVLARSFNESAARVEQLVGLASCCWPTALMNCAHRWRASAWPSRSWAAPNRRPAPRSRAASPSSTRSSARCCWPAAWMR